MKKDIFILHAGKDAAWAEWVAWQLSDADYAVEIDLWDWAAGENFILKMDAALTSATGVVALFSPAFFEGSGYTADEWTAALVGGQRRLSRLIPVEVEPVTLPRVMASLIVPAIHGVEVGTARKRLLQAVAGPGKPATAPPFPAQGLSTQRADPVDSPRIPGVLPSVSNLPPRNPAFVGRASVLEAVRKGLQTDYTVAVQALNGMGGVGKTQIALEYAHQYASGYDTIWWFDAEQATLLGEQYAALAVALGLVDPDASVDAAYRAVCGLLQGHRRWLLVFDNADDPATLRYWLARGAGHTIITSREDGWHEIGQSTVVDVLRREEAVSLVRRHHFGVNVDDAHQIARTLGDLPLALVQASSFLRQSGMPVSEYITELSGHSAELLQEGTPATYSRSLASTIEITMDRLGEQEPGVADVVRLCAFMAPEPISVSWLAGYAAANRALSIPMTDLLVQPSRFRRGIRRIANLGLVRAGQDMLLFHRLVQAVIRDGVEPRQAQRWAMIVDDLVLVSRPPDPDAPTTWQAWSTLLPHIIARANEPAASPQLREMAVDGAWFLLDRGDTRSGEALAAALHGKWLRELGPDNPSTLSAANRAAWGLRDLGRVGEAADLDFDTFDRRRRVLGRDDVDTLRSASNLAADLRRIGRLRVAFRIDCDTFARRQAILGWNDPETLRSAVNLGADLRGLGHYEMARRLHAEARRSLSAAVGHDHPDTLVAAGNLGADLRELGRVAEAKQLDFETHELQSVTLGRDHPDTLRSAMNLIEDHRCLRQLDQVIEIGEDLLERSRRTRGDADPQTTRVGTELVADLRRTGRDDLADQLENDMRTWNGG